MDIVSLRRKNLRNAIDVASQSKGFTSDAAFCEYYNLNPSQISQLVKGHGSFGERAARNLERKIGWDEGFLDESESSSASMIDTSYQYNHGRPIPVISWVQAGVWTDMDSIPAGTEFDELLPPNPKCGKNGYGLVVVGESMLPKFEPNDRIYVNPDFQPDDLKTGDLVIVSCVGDTEATFKKLIKETNKTYLSPLNPNWHEPVIELVEGCRLIGKVVGLYRYI